MAISKEKIQELVGVFYQPTFKTFYVNSVDGNNFVKPIGVFVSLGITTSMKVLEDIKKVILSDENLDACIAEISSKKVADRYLNTITNLTNPKQYKLDEESESVLNEEKAKKELIELKSNMTLEKDLETLQKYAPKVSKLTDLITRLTESSSWDTHLIQRDEEENYKIFHKYVNYWKDDTNDIEYRIGIYVSEKN